MNSALARPRFSRRTLITMVVATVFACLGLASAAQNASATLNCISLTPETATNQLPQQNSHTVTATVRTTFDPVGHPNNAQYPDYAVWWLWYDYWQATFPQGTDKWEVFDDNYPAPCDTPGAPTLPVLPNAAVTFLITSGPNAGQTQTVNTDANGQANFTWSGAVEGTDTVEAATPLYALVDETVTPATITPFGPPAIASATKIWLPPTPPVTPAGTPAAAMAVPKTCQKRKFYITASTSGGTVKKIVLKIDGKTAKVSKTSTIAAGKKFLINTGAYSAGTHKITLTTYFTNGAKVIKTGKFKLCTVRTSQRRVSPNFTG